MPDKRDSVDSALQDPQESLLNAQVSLDNGINTIRNFARNLPNTPGVYRMLNSKGDVLYIGKARDLQRRVISYTRIQQLVTRQQRMVAQTAKMEVTHTRSEAEALILEANMIRRVQPPFNVRLKDDKAGAYLYLSTDHDFPLLKVVYGQKKGSKGTFYGPFASSAPVYETLETMQKAFFVRNCSDSDFSRRKRPCLQYHIKRCSAPCVGKVTKDEYATQIKSIQRFLEGKSAEIQNELAAKMQNASDALDFETAASYRDRIRALTRLQTEQEILPGTHLSDADVIALYYDAQQAAVTVSFIRGGRHYGSRTYFPRHDKQELEADILSAFIAQFYSNKLAPRDILLSSECSHMHVLTEALNAQQDTKWNVHIHIPKRGPKATLVSEAVKNARKAHERHMAANAKQKDLLEGVARLFALEQSPQRIEIYDNSHTGGENMLGAMVVAGPEGFLKMAYRKFLQKDGSRSGADDYGMMAEVLKRRFGRALKDDPQRQGENWPDLILLDGGQGQLSVALHVMKELGLSDIRIAAIAKGPDRNAGREQFFLPDQAPFQLPERDPVLYYLQRLRDEAHRFAISSQRQKRSKSLSKSALDDIPGVGTARKKALLHYFGSAKAVRDATVEDLTRIEGISAALATQIHDWFQGRT